jgi:hypothetical protein
MKAANEASNIALAKLMQEAKILMAHMSSMDQLGRAWHELYRERVGMEVMAALTAAGASATMPSSATPLVIDAEPDAMDVAPPLTLFL